MTRQQMFFVAAILCFAVFTVLLLQDHTNDHLFAWVGAGLALHSAGHI